MYAISNDPRIDKAIRNLPKQESAKIVQVIGLYKDYGFSLPQKYLKKLQTNVWELRSGRYRLLFGLVKGEAIVVNMFLKQTKKTPRQEIKLAVNRIQEYEKITDESNTI